MSACQHSLYKIQSFFFSFLTESHYSFSNKWFYKLLFQGLDMAAVASMNNNAGDDDVVCTPDFPMEPLCEVRKRDKYSLIMQIDVICSE